MVHIKKSTDFEADALDRFRNYLSENPEFREMGSSRTAYRHNNGGFIIFLDGRTINMDYRFASDSKILGWIKTLKAESYVQDTGAGREFPISELLEKKVI